MSRQTTRRVRWPWWVLLTLVALWAIGSRCGGSDDQEVLPFVPYESSAYLISPPDGASIDKKGRAFYFRSDDCVVSWMDNAGEAWSADAFDYSYANWETADEESERNVMFVTMRWSDSGPFDEAVRHMTRSMELPCSTTGYEPRSLTEPIALDGLPAESRALRWLGDEGQIVVVLFDTDSQTAMFIAWKERGRCKHQVCTDDLVEVANVAWTEFLTDNPPLD